MDQDEGAGSSIAELQRAVADKEQGLDDAIKRRDTDGMRAAFHELTRLKSRLVTAKKILS